MHVRRSSPALTEPQRGADTTAVRQSVAGRRRTLARRSRARGRWSRAHAHRLLWRAGFGGRPAEIDFWAARGRQATIDWLVRGGAGPHGRRTMVGPAPTAGKRALDPVNEWGHDHLWWLDRMVRSQRPLQERMTLFWHDHFATRDQDTPLMLAQNRVLRAHALGSFGALLRAVTTDAAMQAFLSLADSDKRKPNENYARELMELFTLGAGAGYSERDVREAARALTGWKGNWREGRPLTVSYVREQHDDGVKRLLGRRGRFDWRDTLDLCMAHHAHAPFLVAKLWAHFVGEPIEAGTRRALSRTYVRSGHRIAPVVRAILDHPALYADLGDPRMVKAPVVHLVGTLRQVGRGVDTEAWTWLSAQMGQLLFSPPSVAGWDEGPAWMSTATMRARFLVATYVCQDAPAEVAKGSADPGWTAEEHVERARAATGRPWTSPATDRELLTLARRFLREGVRPGRPLQAWQAEVTQSALRHLLLAGPEAHLC
jgi:uncharacterized protein (DUF1800 family)